MNARTTIRLANKDLNDIKQFILDIKPIVDSNNGILEIYVEGVI